MPVKSKNGLTLFEALNPFRKFVNREDVLVSAKLLAILAIYLGIMNFARALGFARQGFDVVDRAHVPFLIECFVTFVLGMMLAWQIIARQPLWAAFITVFWEIANIIMRIVGVVIGHRSLGATFLVSSVLLIWGANWDRGRTGICDCCEQSRRRFNCEPLALRSVFRIFRHHEILDHHRATSPLLHRGCVAARV